MLWTSTDTPGCSALTRFTRSTASVSGMLTSTSSTSTGMARSFSSTSLPSTASPAITTSGDMAKMWRRPRLTTAWSSATSILICLIGPLDRYRHGHPGSLPRRAGDAHAPVEHDDALADAEQAEGLLLPRRLLIEPLAVVLDVQPDVRGVAPERDLDIVRVRVAEDVRQRLLHDAKQHDGAV